MACSEHYGIVFYLARHKALQLPKRFVGFLDCGWILKEESFFFFVMHGLHYFMAALLSWCLYERLANTTVVFGHVCIALCSLHIDLSFLAIRSAKHSGHMVE